MRHAASTLLVVGMLWAVGSASAEKTKDMMEFRGMQVPTEPKRFMEQMLFLSQEVAKEGELAERKAQSQDVKSFGRSLVQEHQQLAGQMKDVARQERVQLGAPRPSTSAEKAIAAAEQAFQKLLKTLTGDAFDQAFLAAQVNDHDRLITLAMAGQQQFSGKPLGDALGKMLPPLTQMRQRAYDLLGQRAASMGTGGAGDSDPHRPGGR